MRLNPDDTNTNKIMNANCAISTPLDQFLSENPKFRMRDKKHMCTHPLANGYPQPFIMLQHNTSNHQDLRFDK